MNIFLGIVSATNFSKSSELMKTFLDHFKNSDFQYICGCPFLILHNLGVKLSTTNVTAFGISKIRVENFTSDIVEMKVIF